MRAVQGCVLAMLMVSMLVPSIEAKAALAHVYEKIKDNPNFTLISYALRVAGTSSSFPQDLTTDTTLLAPTDVAMRVAFQKLGITEAGFKASKPLMVYLVAYHTLPEIKIADLVFIVKNITATGNLPDADFWIPTALDWDTSLTLNGQNSTNNLRMFFRNKRVTFRSYASAGTATYKTVDDTYLTIDTAMLPMIGPFTGCKTVAARLVADKRFTSLVLALKTTGLWNTVANIGFTGTLFAPTNPAFASLADDLGLTVRDLVYSRAAIVTPWMKYHISPARVYRTNFFNRQKISTLYGKNLTVTARGSAKVQIAGGGTSAELPGGIDLWACKAVIHPIEIVLLP